uniref:Uncharacterized protein n=1 Tax=Palpitomonas bilix TaxID=652834 RepID=A0A7S3GDP6_9EUKA
MEGTESWTDVSTLKCSSNVSKIAFASSHLPTLLTTTTSVRGQASGVRKTSEEEKKESEDVVNKVEVVVDVLAGGCEDGSVMVWGVDTSTSPPLLTRPCVLDGGHTSQIMGLCFGISTKSIEGSLLMFSCDQDSGTVCVWKGPSPFHLTSTFSNSFWSTSCALSQAPEFTKVQSVTMGECGLFECAISPRTTTFAAVQNARGACRRQVSLPVSKRFSR